MDYEVIILPTAWKDLDDLPVKTAQRIMAKIARLSGNLAGDVTRLTNFTHEYRLRVGDYRVLFDVKVRQVLAQRILHRREAYR